MATETHVHDGSAYRKLKQWHVNDGSAWRKLKKVYCHDGADWKLVFNREIVSVHIKIECSTALSSPIRQCSLGWTEERNYFIQPYLGGWGKQSHRLLLPAEIGNSISATVSLQKGNSQTISDSNPYFGIGIAFKFIDDTYEAQAKGGYAEYSEVWLGTVYSGLTSMTNLGQFNIEKISDGDYSVAYESLS